MDIIHEDIRIRKVKESDLKKLWKTAYKDNLEWMKWNGPYFNDPVYEEEVFVQNIGPKYYVDSDSIGLILYKDKIIGSVSYSFIDGQLKQWIEFGIVIYAKDVWGKGLGTQICKLWIDYIFKLYPYIPHLGYTTWSGNKGMMSIGEKLGMTLEARIRKVRFHQEQYWDSIKYGILREEFYKL